MWTALLACVEVPDGVTLPPAETVEPRVCAVPSAREERRFDRVVLEGQGRDQQRFAGAGIVAADLDGDDDIDLFVPGPDDARLFRNDGAGNFEEDVTAVPARDFTETVGAVAADLDIDGDLDLVVTRFGATDILLWNDGGRFTDSGDPVIGGPAYHSQAPTVADIDLDGVLDVLIAGHGLIDDSEPMLQISWPGDPSRMLLGDGEGGFVDATDRIPEPFHAAYTFVVGVTDLDRDGDPDLFAQNDHPTYIPGLAALNEGDAFPIAPPLMGLEYPRAGMGLGAEDIDGDGLDDFLIPVWNDLDVLRSSAAGPWVVVSAAMNVALRAHEGLWVGWGAEWVDLDFDGDLDGIVASGHLDVLTELGAAGQPIENERDQTYTVLEREGDVFLDTTEAWGLDDPGSWRGFAVADLDGDGWPDLARRDLSGPVVVDLSRCGDASFVTVRPKPLHLAVGAKVTVEAGGQTWTRTVRAGGTSLATGGPPEVTIGLGDLEEIDAIEVTWPDGSRDRVHAPTARTVVVVEAG